MMNAFGNQFTPCYRAPHGCWFLLLTFVATNLLLSGESTNRLAAQETTWQFGVARSIITPVEPMWMSGYGGRDRVAGGTLTELWAKVLVLKPGQESAAVLVTLDIVGIDRELGNEIRTRIAQQHDLTIDRVMLCCSHTHTGPVIGKNLAPLHYLQVDEGQQLKIDRYAERLAETVVDTTSQAFATLAPGSLSWGSGTCDVAVNRRNNTEAQVPQLRTDGKLNGPVDHDVPVMVVKDSNSVIRCLVFGYACHATVLSFYQWSGDYPGFAQIALEERFPEAQAMFWAGCGADQNPLPRRQVELAKHYGDRLALAVAAVVRTRELLPIDATLASQGQQIPLGLSSVPDEAALREQLESKDRYQSALATWLLSRIDREGSLESTYPYPIVTWKLGHQVQWVFLGGEVVVDYSLRIKQEHHGTATWVVGYANDVMAYIPSRRVLREGGYEGGGAMVYYGLPSPWDESVEQLIVDEVTAQLDRD